MPDLRVRLRVSEYDITSRSHVFDAEDPDRPEAWELRFGADNLVLEFDTLDQIETFARNLLHEVTSDA